MPNLPPPFILFIQSAIIGVYLGLPTFDPVSAWERGSLASLQHRRNCRRGGGGGVQRRLCHALEMLLPRAFVGRGGGAAATTPLAISCGRAAGRETIIDFIVLQLLNQLHCSLQALIAPWKHRG